MSEDISRVMNADELTDEQKTSYVVMAYDPETKVVREVLVPRNIVKLKGGLETSAKKHGAEFLNSEVTIGLWEFLPGEPEPAPQMVRLRPTMKGPVHEVIALLSKLITTPEQAVKYCTESISHCGIFESSECMFVALTFFFPGAGMNGTVLASPTDQPTEEQGRLMFNSMISQAEMFRDNLKRAGIDISRKQIILPGGRSI